MAINSAEVLAIIEGCCRGDRASQKALYQHFYGFSMGICLRYADNKLDASSILNDAFFKIFKSIHTYHADKSFKIWLSVIVRNTAVDHYRKNLKQASILDIVDQTQLVESSSVYEHLAYHDLLKLVQMLSPAYRMVFNLFAIDGYNHEEIAEMLCISVGTSKSNLHKARQKLQAMLKESTPVVALNISSDAASINLNSNTQ